MYAIWGMNSIYLSYWLTRICLVYAKSLLVWKRSGVAMFFRICLELKPSSIMIICYQPWNIKLLISNLSHHEKCRNQCKIIWIYFVKDGGKLVYNVYNIRKLKKIAFKMCCFSLSNFFSYMWLYSLTFF